MKMDFFKYIAQNYGEDVATTVKNTCTAYHYIDFKYPQHDIAEQILVVYKNHETLLKIANDIDGVTLYDQPEGWDGFDVWFHEGRDMSESLQAIVTIAIGIKNLIDQPFNTKEVLKSVV